MKNLLIVFCLLCVCTQSYSQYINKDCCEQIPPRSTSLDQESISFRKERILFVCDSLKTSYNKSVEIVELKEFSQPELLNPKMRSILNDQIDNLKSTAKLIFIYCGEVLEWEDE